MRHYLATAITAPFAWLLTFVVARHADWVAYWWLPIAVVTVMLLLQDTRELLADRRREAEFLDRFAIDRLAMERLPRENNVAFRARISDAMTRVLR